MDEVIPETETRIVLKPAVVLLVGIVVGVGVGIAVAAALTAVATEYGDSSVVIEPEPGPVDQIIIEED